MTRVILVLNSDFSPMNVTSLRKGWKLIFKGKAEVIASEGEVMVVTDKKSYAKPSVIRLTNYVVFPYKKIPLSKHNILKRDDNTCAYCNSTKDLTLDHVIPKSKGGLNTWTNLVTACFKCNSRKGDKLLSEVNMVLNKKPFMPTHAYFLSKLQLRDEWKDYFHN